MMMPSLTEESRKKHPYFMHDMILDQPASLKATLEACDRFGEEIVVDWKGSAKFLFTGCGTSFHAALASSAALCALFRGVSTAVQSFELEYYSSSLDNSVLVAFSHSGRTKTTIEAVRKGRTEGARTLAITGTENCNMINEADRLLVVGNGKERSRAHTKSYSSAILASIYLSTIFASKNEDAKTAAVETKEQLRSVPQAVKNMLAKEQESKELAEGYLNSGKKRFFFVGAGPNEATAYEAALKMKESHYSSSEGMELEQFLHGPWVSLKPEDSLVVLMAPRGPSHDRYLDLLRACKVLGVETLVLSNEKSLVEASSKAIVMPETAEVLSPLSYVIPLQLLAYYLTVALGINPDFIHYDSQKYWDARQIIFPPGTH